MDLYFYREPEEAKQQEEEEAVPAPDYGLPSTDFGALGSDQWPAQIGGGEWSTDVVQAPIPSVPAVPTGNWGDQGKKCFINHILKKCSLKDDFPHLPNPL